MSAISISALKKLFATEHVEYRSHGTVVEVKPNVGDVKQYYRVFETEDARLETLREIIKETIYNLDSELLKRHMKGGLTIVQINAIKEKPDCCVTFNKECENIGNLVGDAVTQHGYAYFLATNGMEIVLNEGGRTFYVYRAD